MLRPPGKIFQEDGTFFRLNGIIILYLQQKSALFPLKCRNDAYSVLAYKLHIHIHLDNEKEIFYCCQLA